MDSSLIFQFFASKCFQLPLLLSHWPFAIFLQINMLAKGKYVMPAAQQCNLYIRHRVLVRNDPALEAERPRIRGETTAFGADVGRIDHKPKIQWWRNLWWKICVYKLNQYRFCVVYIIRVWQKTRPTKKLLRVKYTGNSYSYRIYVNVHDHHWNTCELMFTGTRTWVPGLVLISMWSKPESQSKWSAADCMKQYIDEKLFSLISTCTDINSVAREGQNINTPSAEIHSFFGMSTFMPISISIYNSETYFTG